MKDSDRILHTLTAAQSQASFPAFGSKLLITEATAAFQIAFDDRQFNTVRPGMQFDFGAQNFRRVTIKNLSATADLVLEMFYGTAQVTFDYLRTRSTVIRARADLVDTTSGGILLAGIATAADNTTWLIPAGSRRKHTILTNTAAAGGDNISVFKLKVDTTVVIFGTVFPQTARVIEGDDTLWIRAATGSAVVQTEEAFYV